MTSNAKKHIFVIYTHQDLDHVRSVVSAISAKYEIRGSELDLWIDVDRLQAGENWEQSIADALERAVGLLVFLSPASTESHLMRRQIDKALADPDVPILPIMLSEDIKWLTPEVFPKLMGYQMLDLSGQLDQAQLEKEVERIVRATETWVARGAPSPVSEIESAEAAEDLAREARGRPKDPSMPGSRKAVFVVHGHDAAVLAEVESLLQDRDIEPVVLKRIGGADQSLLQKFMQWSRDIQFAIVLLAADDYGASRLQFEAENVGERALQFRTRQNVIFELGYFYGLLGWENVFVLFKDADKPFPNFERPSDIGGVVFDTLDPEGAWKDVLNKRLDDHGF